MANNYIGVVTPSGTAIYPHLTKPDTKFDANGAFKVSLSIPEEEATPVMSKVDEAMEQAKELLPPGKKKVAEPPYYHEVDSDGQETGNIVFKFKMKHKVNLKDGRTIELKPKLFDAQGNLMQDVESIWGGSTLRVSADLVPYYVAATGAGVSARLKAVQIIDLVTGGGGEADQYGFEQTEGYTAPETETHEFAEDEDF